MTSKFQTIVSFIRDIYNIPEDFIPLHEPRFKGPEKAYLIDCIDTTFVSSVGKYVDNFEKSIAEYTGAKYAVSAASGTAALHIALLLNNVTEGDEVITQPLTFIATANAVRYTGALPVFVDVDKDTLGLSPEKLEKFLKEKTEFRQTENSDKPASFNLQTGKRISACIPMHTFGHPARIDDIAAICTQYNIRLIEDAAESLGSFYLNKHTGTFGEIGILSFNGNKIITTGGGGMLITDDEALAKLAKHLTTQAKIPHPWEYRHDFIGYNYRMTNLAAALGVAQLEQLQSFLKSKREVANSYELFFNENDIDFITEPQNAQSNYWLNAILLNDRKERDAFLKYTNEQGVMTRPVWELMNNLTMYQNFQVENIDNAIYLADRIVNIPSSAKK